ncbi:MAG: ATP synthase F0 subunit B, partial [Coriobacteriia bacterium]|nr:ATP synthase F0 subunit B [Coriobacteriia bacterium]
MDLNPLNQINPPVIVSVMAIFSATYAVARKVYFLPYIRVMEAREARFEAARAQHSEADRMWGEAEASAAEIVAEAQTEADSVVRAGKEQAERERKTILEDSMAEVSEMLERGRAEIAKARESELATLRQQASDCVGLACEKLVGGVDPVTVETAVDKLIA